VRGTASKITIQRRNSARYCSFASGSVDTNNAGRNLRTFELDGMTADRLDDLAREISTRSGTAEMMRYIYASLSRMIHK
jgi:hypothetical protein